VGLYNLAISAYAVSEESGTPSGEDPANTLGSTDLAECLYVATVKLRIDLTTALDQVKGGDGSVGESLYKHSHGQ
jgi:hypothetical protein